MINNGLKLIRLTAKSKLHNKDFSLERYPAGLTISDVPYNQAYRYNSYKDKLSLNDYMKLLKAIPKPCVIIHYPEETINILPKIWGQCEEVVSWVYNSNTGKQSRLISWWGCKPDFSRVGQPYKNRNDKRIQALEAEGRQCKLYDWWEIQQVKNTSVEKTLHSCQTPEEVIRRIIAITATEGTTIIDPFAGSGTTLAMAKKAGYDSIGFEIDPFYYQIAKDRIAKTVVKGNMYKPANSKGRKRMFLIKQAA